MTIPQINDGVPVGTVSDMAARVRSTLPTGWFAASPPAPAPTATPVLDGLLAGFGAAWSFCFGLLAITAAQSRVATAVGGFLDMMAADFFGSQLARRAGEPDETFRSRIRTSLVSRRGTRSDVSQAVRALTSVSPLICEPDRSFDCGGYGGGQQAAAGGGLGYCTPGLRYGSASMAFQYFLTVAPSVAYAPGTICTRESPATYLDNAGLIKTAAPRVLRPDFRQGVCVGALVEASSFNLITDSRLAGGFTQSGSAAQGGAVWWLDHGSSGLFGSDPVMRVTAPAGNRIAGPSIDVASAGAMVTGSVWLFVGANSGLTAVELCLTDLNVPGGSVYASADMTRYGQWQRVSASLQTQAAAGRNMRFGLLLSGNGGADAMVMAQCWQVEPGPIATSYIPSSGSLGFRAKDDTSVTDPGAVPTTFVAADVDAAIAQTIPTATIAWTSMAIA